VNRYPEHRRSNSCIGRPAPVPELCEVGHGRPWPCALCEIVALLGLAFTEVEVAQTLGVSVAKVHEEVLGLRRQQRLAEQR
jgi:hypothetical protein